MYVVTRSDLSPGYQVVQSCHAVREFDQRHHGFEGIANLACLAVKNEDELKSIVAACERDGIKYAAFREPDIGDQVTAVAIEPDTKAKRMLRRLPLALAS